MPRKSKCPTPLKRPPDLFGFLRLCGIENFNGALGAFHRCPRCEGIPRNAKPGWDALRASARDWSDSLADRGDLGHNPAWPDAACCWSKTKAPASR